VKRPTLIAAVIYAVLAALMVGQGLLPGRTLSGSDWALSSVPWVSTKPASVPGLGTNYELADSADVFQPFLQYTRSRLPSAPLWNPFVGVGRPFLADGQSAVLSPFSVPSYVLPFWKSLAVVAILKLFLAALGTFLLARALGLRFGGALLAGLVFAFGTYFVIWLAWPLSSVFAFIPWALALTERLVRRRDRLTAAGLSVVIGLQFLGGHPESSFHLALVTSAFFVFRLLAHRHRDRRRAPPAPASPLRPILFFVIAMAGGAALAALVLAPFAEFVLHSGDLARRQHVAASSYPAKYLGALFLHDYWGRPTQIDLEPFTVIRGWYAGAATLMLALVALLRRRPGERLVIALFALFCVCMVVHIEPVVGLVEGLPVFSAVHNERLLIYFLLCLALLAGWGLDDLSATGRPSLPSRRLALGACAVTFCVPVIWMVLAGTLSLHELGAGLRVAWGFEHPPAAPPGVSADFGSVGAIVRDSALLMWLPLAGAGLVLVALRLWRPRMLGTGAFVALMVLVVAVDLFRANMGFNPAIPTRTASPPLTGAIRYLQSQRPARFIGVSTDAVTQPLPSDFAMRFGLFDARGYDFPVEKHLDELWRADVANGALLDFTQPEQYAGATPAALRALSLLSVHDLLLGPQQAAQLKLHGPGLRIAYRGADGVVYANDRALPRVFLVASQQPVSGDAAALATVSAPGFDARRVAVTDHPLPGLPTAAGGAATNPGSGSARLRSYGPERIVVDASAPRHSLVVLTDDFYPGWQATVDGRAQPVQRVDLLLRGVSVGPGQHTVVLRYVPASWRIGWIVSLVAVLALVAVLLSAIRLRRRGTSSAAGPGAQQLQ